MSATPRRAVVLPPGWHLRRELDARRITQREFARRIGRPEQVISMIIQGKKTITPETSIATARELGTSLGFWHRLSADYEMHVAEKAAARDEHDVRAWRGAPTSPTQGAKTRRRGGRVGRS